MTAIARADIMLVRFSTHQITAVFQISDDLTARGIAVQTGVTTAVFVDVPVLGQDVQIGRASWRATVYISVVAG